MRWRSKMLMAELYGLLEKLLAAMNSGTFKLDPRLRRRAQLFTLVSRGVSVAVSLVALLLFWDRPQTRRLPCLAVALGYALWSGLSFVLLRRNPRRRSVKVAHDVADALAVGLAAWFSGAIGSPLWLLLYLHIAAVSVRGGLRYALAMGCLDAGIVAVLAYHTPGNPLLAFHAVALFGSAFVGGTFSAHFRDVRGRLAAAFDELQSKNEQLVATLAAGEQSRAEQEAAIGRLRASELRYQRLLERIQDGVVIIQDSRIVYANAHFAAMLGESAEALNGVDFRELIPFEDRNELEERYRRWQESQGAVRSPGILESRLSTRTGQLLLVSVRASSVEYEGKRSVIATVRDVSRQRQMEQELKAHAARLAAINEIANAVNLSLTIEDIFGVAGDEVRHLVSFDRLTIALLDDGDPAVEVVAVGAGGARQVAPFTRDAVSWAFRRPRSWCHGGEEPPPHLVQGLLAEAGMVSIATVPLVSKKRVIGSMNLGRFRPLPFTADDLAALEPVARHVAIALDNARLIEAVKRRSQELESLLEVGRGIASRLELDALLPLVTRSVNRLMGTHFCVLLLKRGELLRLAAHEGVEPEVVLAFDKLPIGQSLSGWVAREGKALTVDDMRKDPRAKFAEITSRFGYRSYLCVPLKLGEEVLGTLEVVTKELHHFHEQERGLMAAFAAQAAVAIANARLFEDARQHLAETRDANRRLEQLDTLRQQYLRNVSHEFRTPLTVIKGYADYLLGGEGADSAAVRDVMRVILESSDRVIDLVDTLIEVSRVEQGGAEHTLRVESLDLRELAATSVEPLRAHAKKKRIELGLEFPEGPLLMQGDGGLLQQLVRKLVDNALKYSPAGARVSVRGHASGDALCLEVEDTGIGIPAEHIPQIFQKFYTVDGGLARRAGGTGVGLYLVQEIVRLHKGSVDVRSRPGQGSVFSVKLPQRFQTLDAELR
jgi:PAS domain S-box-containing protein